jgi:tripartite-type tricarboxylate transporter receptor subunit TctC
VRSFADFMTRAKGESGGIEYVSAGVGTVGNWVAEYLAAKTGIKLVHVAYKGGANAVLDLIAGHVKVGMLTYSSVSEQVRAGALLPLVVTASARLPQMPNVPTFRELDRPQMRKLMDQDAIETKAMSPAEVTQYFQSEIDKWQPIIARIMTAK